MLVSVVRMLLTTFLEEIARPASCHAIVPIVESPDPPMLPPQCPLWRVAVGTEPCSSGVVESSARRTELMSTEHAAPYVAQI
jgi:hypothetical protein